MAVCPDCGADNPGGSAYCEDCGRVLSPPVYPAGGGSGTAPAVTTVVSPAVRELGDLVVLDGADGRRGLHFGLTGHRQRIGRGPLADIALLDPSVGREHALIWFQDGFFYIQDEASRNGTFVGDRRVVRHALRDGDEIRVGDTMLVLRVLPHRLTS